jgi:uncharacterized membrane protein
VTLEPAAPPFDARPEGLEIVIPKLLRGGLFLAASLMAAGLLLLATRQGATSAVPFSLANLPALLSAGDPRAVVGMGILILLATPLVRVVASFVYFARQKDRLYVVLTAVVLANLALAAALGAV